MLGQVKCFEAKGSREVVVPDCARTIDTATATIGKRVTRAMFSKKKMPSICSICKSRETKKQVAWKKERGRWLVDGEKGVVVVRLVVKNKPHIYRANTLSHSALLTPTAIPIGRFAIVSAASDASALRSSFEKNQYSLRRHLDVVLNILEHF